MEEVWPRLDGHGDPEAVLSSPQGTGIIVSAFLVPFLLSQA